jgi:hypothetical protein
MTRSERVRIRGRVSCGYLRERRLAMNVKTDVKGGGVLLSD